jgi:hypothetical protein
MLGDRPRVDAATLSKADNEMLFVMGYECRRVGARGSRGKKSKYEEFDKAAGIEGLPRGTLQGRRLKARERLEPAFEAMQADIDALRARSLEERLIEPPELKQPPEAERQAVLDRALRCAADHEARAPPVAVSPGDAVTSLFDGVIWDGIVDRVEGDDAVEVHYFLDHNMHTHKVDELRVLRPAAGCLGALRERGDGDAMDVPAAVADVDLAPRLQGYFDHAELLRARALAVEDSDEAEELTRLAALPLSRVLREVAGSQGVLAAQQLDAAVAGNGKVSSCLEQEDSPFTNPYSFHTSFWNLCSGEDGIGREVRRRARARDWNIGRPNRGRTRVIQLRFNVSVPHAPVLEKASTLRDRSER